MECASRDGVTQSQLVVSWRDALRALRVTWGARGARGAWGTRAGVRFDRISRGTLHITTPRHSAVKRHYLICIHSNIQATDIKSSTFIELMIDDVDLAHDSEDIVNKNCQKKAGLRLRGGDLPPIIMMQIIIIKTDSYV